MGIFDAPDRLGDALASGPFEPWGSELKKRRKELERAYAAEQKGPQTNIIDLNKPDERSEYIQGQAEKTVLGEEARARAKKMRPDLFNSNNAQTEKASPIDEWAQQSEMRRRRRMAMAGAAYGNDL